MVRMGALKCVIIPVVWNRSLMPFTDSNGKYLWKLESDGFLVYSDAGFPQQTKHRSDEIRQSFSKCSSSHLLCILTWGQILLGPHANSLPSTCLARRWYSIWTVSPPCAGGQKRGRNGRELNSISITSQGVGLRAVQLPRSSVWCGHQWSRGQSRTLSPLWLFHYQWPPPVPEMPVPPGRKRGPLVPFRSLRESLRSLLLPRMCCVYHAFT